MKISLVWALAATALSALSAQAQKAPTTEANFVLGEAKQFRKAMDQVSKGKDLVARGPLLSLSKGQWLREPALWELAQLEHRQKNWEKSLEHVRSLELLRSAPSLERRLEFLERECLWQSALQKARSAKSLSTRKAAVTMLQDFFSQIPYRQWQDREEGLDLLLNLMKRDGHPLFREFLAELLVALPQDSPVRKKVFQEVKSGEISSLTDFPRLRFGDASVATKPTYPDQELFDKAMEQVLQEEWLDAEVLFAKLVKEFPDSEHADRSRFWIGKMLEERGLKEEGQKRSQEILQRSPVSWYGVLSAMTLGSDLRTRVVKEAPPEEPVTGTMVPRQRLAFLRASAFLEVGLTAHARDAMEDFFSIRPAGWAFGQDSAPRTFALAKQFSDSGFHLGAFAQGMSLAEQSPNGIAEAVARIIFPKPFTAEVTEAEKSTRVPALLLWSLMKQESGFLPHAVSKSNAIGLTQVLPTTAREVDPNVSGEMLFRPEVSARVGATYLASILERFEGNAALALAAYNAGPSRATAWFKKYQESPLAKKGFRVDVFVDTIPFTETRKYVGVILRNLYWYRLLEGAGAPKNAEELAQIWPKENQKQ